MALVGYNRRDVDFTQVNSGADAVGAYRWVGRPLKRDGDLEMVSPPQQRDLADGCSAKAFRQWQHQVRLSATIGKDKLVVTTRFQADA